MHYYYNKETYTTSLRLSNMVLTNIHLIHPFKRRVQWKHLNDRIKYRSSKAHLPHFLREVSNLQLSFHHFFLITVVELTYIMYDQITLEDKKSTVNLCHLNSTLSFENPVLLFIIYSLELQIQKIKKNTLSEMPLQQVNNTHYDAGQIAIVMIYGTNKHNNEDKPVWNNYGSRPLKRTQSILV